MLDYIFSPNPDSKNLIETTHFSFFSYKAVSDCNPQLTEILIKEKKYLKKIFSLINDNLEKNLTSRGYFQSILKNFLSDLNSHLVLFVKRIKENPEQYVFPLVKNLNKANSEIIKDILTSENPKLKKLQLCIFEYLLFYFLNEQFKRENADEQFKNLNDIFSHIQTIDNVYKYKLKYEHTLYSEEFVKNQQNKENIYSVKLSLLNYIAATK